MKKKTLILVATMLLGSMSQAVAQVNDVNFTASVTSSYNYWNKSLNLGESPAWGLKAGFNFGPLVQISGIYEKSFDLKGELQGAGWSTIQKWGDKMKGSEAKMERLGGEIRLNVIPVSFITPYLTAGAGIMNIKYDDKLIPNKTNKDEQVYASLGAGLKFNFGRRVALSLEGRDLIFNVNKNNAYLAKDADPDKTLHNWGARASLDFYLGGTAESNDDITRAYRKQFAGGFRGLRFVAEPGVAYVNFDDSSLFQDQWFMGGALGLDFNSYFGIRGFYYQATYDPSKLEFDFTESLKMYGGNFVARMNIARGVTPYLNLGAGYLDVNKNNYNDAMGGHKAESGWFAMGGAGLEIPFNDYIVLHGSANAMLNHQENPLRKITELNDVNISMMYKAGLRINFGSRSRNAETLYQDYANGLVESEKALSTKSINELRAAKELEINELRANYDKEIAELNLKLTEALKEDDLEEVERLVEEKKEVKEAKETLDKAEEKLDETIIAQEKVALKKGTATKQEKTEGKKLTKSELEALIARVVAEANGGTNVANGLAQMSDLDKILLFSALSNGQNYYPQMLLPQVMPMQQLTPAQATATKKTEEVKKATPEAKPVVAPVTAVAPKVEAAKAEPTTKTASELALEARIKALETQIKNKEKELQIEKLEAKLKMLSQEEAEIANISQPQPIRIVQVEEAEAKTTKVKKAPKQVQQPQQIEVIRVKADGEVEAKTVEIKKAEPAKADPIFSLQSVDTYAGMNFGEATTFNLGLRANLQYKDSDFSLSPEVLYGFGSKGGFGLFVNGIYQINALKDSFDAVTPYVGLGYGFSNTDGTNWGTNIILGAKINNVLGGKLFVDYSIRSLFDNNQIAIGYSFNF